MSVNIFPISVSSGTNQNGFSLDTPSVLSNSSASYIFSENQPAGRYTISGPNTNYDMYLVSSSGQNVGYSNTGSIVATATFNRIVIYNASPNSTYAFSYKLLGLSITNGTLDSGAGPILVSANPVILPNVNSTTTVTGGNFASDVRAFFINSLNVETEAKLVIRNSPTEIVVTRPDSMPLGTYSLRVVNNSIAAPIRGLNRLNNLFNAGQVVQWVTAILPAYTTNVQFSTTLVATDPEGSNVLYSLQAGQLPPGMSLSSGGVISGTSTSTLFFAFTIRATDAGGYFADREFSLSRPSTLTVRTTSQTVNIPQNTTPFLIIGGGGAGGNGFFTTGSWRGGGSGYITAGTVNAGNYSLTVGAGGVGGGYDAATSGGGATTFGSFTAAGGNSGRDGGAGGSAGGNGIGVVSSQLQANAANGFINGQGNGGSGIIVPSAFVRFTDSELPLEMRGGSFTWNDTESRPGATGGRFYSGGGGTKSTNNFGVNAAINTLGGNGSFGGGGGAGGGGASNTFTGPGGGVSGNGGNGILATLTFS